MIVTLKDFYGGQMDNDKRDGRVSNGETFVWSNFFTKCC